MANSDYGRPNVGNHFFNGRNLVLALLDALCITKRTKKRKIQASKECSMANCYRSKKKGNTSVLAFSYCFTRATVLSKVGRQKKRRGLLMGSPKILEIKQSFNLWITAPSSSRQILSEENDTRISSKLFIFSVKAPCFVQIQRFSKAACVFNIHMMPNRKHCVILSIQVMT